MTTTFSPRVSKLSIIPVDCEHFLNAILYFEKFNDKTLNSSVFSLKDICTRRLLLFFGDNHQIYPIYLSNQLIRYVTYDYLTETNNIQCRSMNDDKTLLSLKLLFCRDCSINDLGGSKCRRRKCLANRVRQALNELSYRIIPWEKQQSFAILENDNTNDDEDENLVIFFYIKSTRSRHETSNKHQWIEEQFHLLDLLRILHINMYQQ